MRRAPTLQREAVRQLAELADAGVAQEIAERLLSTEDSEVAGEAIKALGQCGTERAVEALVEVLFRLERPDSDSRFGEDIGWGSSSTHSWGDRIHTALAKIKEIGRLPALLAERLVADDEWIRVLAIREIERWLRDAAATPGKQETVTQWLGFTPDLLEAALAGPDPEVRSAAAVALKWVPGTVVVDELQGALTGGEPNRRKAAAVALGWIEDESSIEFLLSALDDIPEVRIGAAAALGRMHADISLEVAIERVLAIALDATDGRLRREAGKALTDIRSLVELFPSGLLGARVGGGAEDDAFAGSRCRDCRGL